MEGTSGSSKMNEVDSRHNQHKYFLATQTRFQSALQKFKSDIKMFNEFRDLLVSSFPGLRLQIPETKSIVKSCSTPSVLLSSEQLYVSSVPATPSSQVSKSHSRSVKINKSGDAQALSLVQKSRSNSQGGGLRSDNSVQDSQSKFETRTEEKCIIEENDVTKLQREKGEYLNRIEQLEKDATKSHEFVLKLQKQFNDLTKIQNELQEHLLDESASRLHKHQFVSDSDFIELLPTAGNNRSVPCGSTTVPTIDSEIIDKIKFRYNNSNKTVATQVEPADFQLSPDETGAKVQRGQLGSLDDALAFRKEVIKVEDIDRTKILAILEERSHVVLQRHFIIAIIRNQINEKKLDKIQTNFDYLMTRFKQLSQMNSNLCKELTEQLKELHSARSRIVELMQLVPLAELEAEMKNEEKNKKSIPTMMSTSLLDRRETSEPVLLPRAYTPPHQTRRSTKESSKFKSWSYREPQHSSYSFARSHDTSTGESMNKSLAKGSEESSRSFEKVMRTQEDLKKRLGYSSRDTGNRSLENTGHSVETETHRTRPGSPISIGPSDYRSNNPDPTVTDAEPNETSTRRKLFSWNDLFK